MIIKFEKRRSTEISFEVEIGGEYASKTPAEQRGAAIVKALSEKKDLRGSDLNYINLSGADLSGSNLSGSDLSGSDLSGADLSGADLRGSDLRGANLSYSNLSGSDLSYSNLNGSDLSGADLRGCGLSVLLTDIWTVYLQKEHIRVGRQYHTASEWFAFSDDEIGEMDELAQGWWKKWKPVIQAAHAALLQGEPV